MKSTLHKTIIVGLFSLPFIPFLVTNSLMFPFISGKVFAFRIIIEIIFALWLTLVLQFEEFRPKISKLTISIVLFIVVVGLANILGENPTKSFWSNFERMDGYFTLLHLGILFFIASTILNSEKLWIRLFQTSVWASFFITIYGLLQVIGKIPISQNTLRIDALFGNPSYFGAYLAIHFFLTFFLFLKSFQGKGFRNFQTLLYLTFMVFQLITVVLTGTRGSIMAVFIGLIIYSIIAFYGKPAVWKKISAIFLLILIIGIGLLIIFKDTPNIKNSILKRLVPLATLDIKRITEDEAKSRILIWNLSWQGVKENPIIGYGQENFNLVFDKHYDPKLYKEEAWFDRAHNFIFDWLIAAGFLGLLSYLGIFIIAIYLVFKHSGKENPDHLSLPALLSTYLFQNLFIFDQINTSIFCFIILAYIEMNYAPKRDLLKSENKHNQLKKNKKNYNNMIANKKWLLSTFMIIVLFSIYRWNIRPILASKEALMGLNYGHTSLNKSTDHFEKALHYKTFGNPEIREGLAMIAESATAVDLSLEEKKRLFIMAKKELAKQTEETPKDARYMSIRGQLLASVSDISEAIPYLEKAVSLSPKKQVLRLALGSAYLKTGDYQEAKTILKETYELAPDFLEARSFYALALFFAGEDALAHELMKGVYGPYDIVPEERFINAYLSKGQYNRVLKAWQAWAERYPEVLDYRLSIVASHLLLQNRADAINELRRTIKDFPEFKVTGEFYIAEIMAGRDPSKPE